MPQRSIVGSSFGNPRAKDGQEYDDCKDGDGPGKLFHFCFAEFLW
jgi:hypothetical protein